MGWRPSLLLGWRRLLLSWKPLQRYYHQLSCLHLFAIAYPCSLVHALHAKRQFTEPTLFYRGHGDLALGLFCLSFVDAAHLRLGAMMLFLLRFSMATHGCLSQAADEPEARLYRRHCCETEIVRRHNIEHGRPG